MSDIAIRAERLSKLYRIGARLDRHATLRDQIAEALAEPFRRLRGNGNQLANTHNPADTIWALKDVSFQVQRGEILGLIGRNGAGKSTLLKILSRITDPTEGYVEIDGRVGTLLEVGTGFHPELTGRENIYLNGAILGMERAEIERKFDEIVDFAEVEKFIDTPVKRYSSGMYVRLAFAVAAHLEPEVLIVDEVLAVGDAAFQKKCLGKMGDVAKEGRTVLFVSHNIASVVSFCTRCLLLEHGCLTGDGTPQQITSRYLEQLYTQVGARGDLKHLPRRGSGKARFTSCILTPLDSAGKPQIVCKVGQDIQVDLDIVATEKIANANVGVEFYSPSDYRVIDANIALQGEFLSLNAGEQAHVRFVLQNVLLKPDAYHVALWLGIPHIEDIDYVQGASWLSVDINPERTKHFEIFPGVYQCEFTHAIAVRPRLVDSAHG